jgi:class 3 adenylate cyclase
MPRIPSKFQRLIVNSLSQSMPIHTMVRIMKLLNGTYDLYERTGFPPTIPIPSIDAAKQITRDIIQDGRLVDFVKILVEVNTIGMMGKKISIRFLSQIIKELETLGYVFDEATGNFKEKSNGRTTAHWGVLLEGKTYDLTFLMMDIVQNTELVRKYDQAFIADIYGTVRDMFVRIIEKRNGRVWIWEGDGGLAAFYFDDKNIKAVLCGIELLLELFFYNLMKSPLKEGLKVRLSVHTGPCQLATNIEKSESDTINTLKLLSDEFTLPDSMTISPSVYSDMGSKLELFFKPVTLKTGKYLYRYRMEWED